MRFARWNMTLSTFFGFITLAIVSIGLSILLLRHASPFWSEMTTVLMLAWFALLSILIASGPPRWKAFALAGLLMTSTHIALSNEGSIFNSYSGDNPKFPTNAMLHGLWDLLNDDLTDGDADSAADVDPFGGGKRFPLWDNFTRIGAALSSIWLGIGAGLGAYLLRSWRDIAATQPPGIPAAAKVPEN